MIQDVATVYFFNNEITYDRLPSRLRKSHQEVTSGLSLQVMR